MRQVWNNLRGTAACVSSLRYAIAAAATQADTGDVFFKAVCEELRTVRDNLDWYRCRCGYVLQHLVKISVLNRLVNFEDPERLSGSVLNTR